MLGLPTGTDLNGIADKLGTIVASLGPEESAVVTGAISQLSDHAAALEKQTATDIGAMFAEITPRLDTFNQNVGSLLLLVGNGFKIVPNDPKTP